MFRGEISLWKRADVSCTSQHHMAGCDSETGKRHKHTSRTQQRRSQKCPSVEFQVVRPSTSVLHCFIGEQRSRSMPPFLSSRATGWTGVDIIPLLQEQLRLKVSLTPGVQHSHRNSPHTAHRSISLPQYRLIRSFQALDHLQRLGLAMDRHGAAVGNGAKISPTDVPALHAATHVTAVRVAKGSEPAHDSSRQHIAAANSNVLSHDGSSRATHRNEPVAAHTMICTALWTGLV